MKVEKTKLDNVLLFKPDIFEDFRGEYVETYNEKKYTDEIKKATGETVHFVQDSFSMSSKRVLRGFHGDDKTWKLIDCFYGRIYLVILEIPLGKWQSFILSDKNRHQILVPPMHGVAHLVLSKKAIFHYKQSTYYDPKTLKQFTYRYDDPQFNVWWPGIKPILSQRDEKGN